MKNEMPAIRTAVERIYDQLLAAGRQTRQVVAQVHRQQQQSATNLMHYMALRRVDVRSLQDKLHDAGLSSLASAEGHILRQVQEVLCRTGGHISPKAMSKIDAATGAQLLLQRSASLFGEKVYPGIPYLMVTLDTVMAEDYEAVEALIKGGMNIARINCAHDDQDVWKKMVRNIKKAARATSLPCKIYFDLAGPKIRTTIEGKGRKKGRMKLRVGEVFYLAEADAQIDRKNKIAGCSLPGVIKDLQPGHRVMFDDGLFEAVVEVAGEWIAILKVVRMSAPKGRLKSEKGINFPDTQLTVPSLTDFDKSVLPFACRHADLLGYSFVRSAADVALLQDLLSAKKLPVILKIETLEAVQNLPELLLQGMAEPLFGVMIARGDLAVEIGFERLSEVQEEILWLCEAAHVPVIWATQVLENMNKSGIATRSELTDAALSTQAECVMLNKGQYLLNVLATLQDILKRSGGHHVKKRYTFRALNIAARFWESVH